MSRQKKRLPLEKLFKPFARPLAEQLHDFERPISSKLIRKKETQYTDKNGKVHKNYISYVPWFALKRLADHYSPGWNYEVLEEGPVMFMKKVGKGSNAKHIEDPHLLVKVRITIFYSHDGEIRSMHRDGTGAFPIKNAGYGDPYTNAEAKALRRGWSKFGLGISLYYPDGTYTFHELDEEGQVTDIVGELPEAETGDEALESGHNWDDDFKTYEPDPEEDVKDVLASQLYEVSDEAGFTERVNAEVFGALVLGHKNPTKFSRLSPDERVLIYHVLSELRLTIKKIDKRKEFAMWLVNNQVRIVSRDGVSAAVDHWISTM